MTTLQPVDALGQKAVNRTAVGLQGSGPGTNSLLFTDENCVAPAQVSSVSSASQVGHQLQVVSVFVHKPRD